MIQVPRELLERFAEEVIDYDGDCEWCGGGSSAHDEDCPTNQARVLLGLEPLLPPPPPPPLTEEQRADRMRGRIGELKDFYLEYGVFPDDYSRYFIKLKFPSLMDLLIPVTSKGSSTTYSWHEDTE